MNENEKQEYLFKVACARIARRGLQEATTGDFGLGQTLCKVADALCRGRSYEEVINENFPTALRTKAAAFIGEVVEKPSEAAVQYLGEKRAELKQQFLTARQQGKVAQAQGVKKKTT